MARKLKIFQNIRKAYQLLDINLDQRPVPNYQFNWKICAMLLCMVLVFVATSAFILFKADAHDYGASFTGLFMEFFITIIFVINFVEMPNIYSFIEMMEAFIDERCEKSKLGAQAYIELNRKIEHFTKWAIITLVYITTVGAFVPSLLISFVKYYVYDLNDDSFRLGSQVMLPFNWKTPLGFLIANAFISMAGCALLYALTLTLSLYAGACSLFSIFSRDISTEVAHLILGGKSKCSKEKFKQHFCNVIHLDSRVRQIVDEFNHIYEFITFNYFLWTILCECVLLLGFLSQLSDPNPNPTELFNSSMGVIWTFGLMFLYCEVGERVDTSFNLLHEELCHCDWYLFPVDVKRIFIIVLLNTQESPTIHGYANTDCTRDAFKRTVRVGVSYFTMLRRINN